MPRTAILVCGASPHDAEDLVQNALEKIYRHWSRVRHDNPESYARRDTGEQGRGRAGMREWERGETGTREDRA